MEAVSAYHNEVSGDILLKQAEFRDLRNKLLQWPLSFYQKVTELPGPENQDPKNLSNIADMYARLGLITRDVGTQEKAIECFRRANTLLEKVLSDDPKAPKVRADVAFNHNQIAGALMELGRYPEALEEYRIALRIREELSATTPGAMASSTWVANVHGNIGILLENWGRPKEALEWHRKALAIREVLVRDEPDTVGFLETLASSYLSMYDLQEGLLKLEFARKAASLYEDVTRRTPRDTKSQYRLGVSLHHLGTAQREAGELAEAERSWCRARNGWSPSSASSRPWPTYKGGLAWLLRDLAELELGTGRADQGF